MKHNSMVINDLNMNNSILANNMAAIMTVPSQEPFNLKNMDPSSHKAIAL